MPKSSTRELREQRGAVHGNFEEGARISQGTMQLWQTGSKWNELTDAQRECLHMIAHKVHRILTGNPNHQDHWDDIAGYAHLAIPDHPVAQAAEVARKEDRPSGRTRSRRQSA